MDISEMSKSFIVKKLSSIFEMRTAEFNSSDDKEHLIIPHLQRGLVWTPKQIVDLWDSISKGYPIGAFMCVRARKELQQGQAHEKSYFLMDGQQRCNAICTGFDMADSNNAQATLWIEGRSDIEAPKFMVCTARHPWGFQPNNDRLPSSAMDDANRIFRLGKSDSKFATLAEQYRTSDLKSSWPFRGKLPLPLPFLLDENTGYNKYKEFLSKILASPANERLYFPKHLLHYLVENAEICGNYSLIVDLLCDKFTRFQNSDWIKRTREAETALIIVSEDIIDGDSSSNTDKLEELFIRINNGGTSLSPADSRYSHITAHWGGIKEVNEKIAENFLPPNRLISIAGRLAEAKKLKAHNGISTFPKAPSSIDISNWKKSGHKEFEALFEGRRPHLENVIEKFKNITGFGKQKDKCISPYIYLQDNNDDWLFVLIFIIDRFLLNKANINDDVLIQLCMLPHVLMASNTSKSKESFSKVFYLAICDLDENMDMGQIIAYGIISCALNPDTFMYPYPEKSDREKKYNIASPPNEYCDYWLHVYSKITGTSDNPLLYFYLRNYLKIIPFNPALRSSWDGSLNKPWDMDHIVPRSWWTDNMTRDSIGNMQPLHFSDNRSKSDQFIGIDSESDFFEDKKKLLRYGKSMKEETIGERKSTANDELYKEEVVFPRFGNIVKSTYDELGISSIIKTINTSIFLTEPAIKARNRYNFFKDVSEELQKRLSDEKILISWGAVIYGWKQQGKNVRDTISLPIKDGLPSFYESLTPWLSVGIEMPDAHICICSDCQLYEIGIRRIFRRSAEEHNEHRQIFTNVPSLVSESGYSFEEHNPWWYFHRDLPKELPKFENIVKELITLYEAYPKDR